MKVFWPVGKQLEMDEPLDSSECVTDDDKTDDNDINSMMMITATMTALITLITRTTMTSLSLVL